MIVVKEPCRTCSHRFEMLLSTISPCDHCEHNEFNTTLSFPDERYHYEITTYTTPTAPLYTTSQPNTTTVVEKEEPPFQKGLPTREEYNEKLNPFNYALTDWSEPKYICPKCGGNMRRDETHIIASNPIKRMYQCDKCAFIEFLRA